MQSTYICLGFGRHHPGVVPGVASPRLPLTLNTLLRLRLT